MKRPSAIVAALALCSCTFLSMETAESEARPPSPPSTPAALPAAPSPAEEDSPVNALWKYLTVGGGGAALLGAAGWRARQRQQAHPDQ